MMVIKRLLVNIVTTYLIQWAEWRHEMVMGWDGWDEGWRAGAPTWLF